MSEEQAVETIARAIRGAHGADPEVSIFPSYDWRIEAEAALAALREQQGWKSPEETETLVTLLREFDAYASVDDGTPYSGSPFQERVRRVLVGDEQA